MFASGLIFNAASAWAAAPPAHTVIGNQATANYLDPNGLTQSATSNLVQTTVQKVGSFALDGVTTVTTNVQNTKTGAASAVLKAPHVLTNTGNDTDSFLIDIDAPGPNGSNPLASIAVFVDSDNNGEPDNNVALCTISGTGKCSVPAQSIAGNNGKFGFVVTYTLPSTVNTTMAPYASATISARPVTVADYAAGNQAAAVVDNVNTTTTAAFNLTKALQQPASGITAPGGGAWPVVAVTGKRSATGASCPTTWAAGLTSSATCQYAVYTLTYSNTGGAAGRFVLQDVIGSGSTSGLTYVAGSAVWSSASGTALGDGAGGDPVGSDFAFDSGTKTLTFVDNNLPVNTQRSISFVALVGDRVTVKSMRLAPGVTRTHGAVAGRVQRLGLGQTDLRRDRGRQVLGGWRAARCGTAREGDRHGRRGRLAGSGAARREHLDQDGLRGTHGQRPGLRAGHQRVAGIQERVLVVVDVDRRRPAGARAGAWQRGRDGVGTGARVRARVGQRVRIHHAAAAGELTGVVGRQRRRVGQRGRDHGHGVVLGVDHRGIGGRTDLEVQRRGRDGRLRRRWRHAGGELLLRAIVDRQ